MRKLRLNVDHLAVESFDVSPETPAGEGTVHGRQDKVDGHPRTNDRLGTCLPGVCTCDGQSTCDYSGCIACPPSDPMICPVGAGVIEEKLGPSY